VQRRKAFSWLSVLTGMLTAKKTATSVLKMPSTQRRRGAKAQSIFMVIGADRHVDCEENSDVCSENAFNAKAQRSKGAKHFHGYRCRQAC
jgi:hypothetical protein